ncbi:MAG: hypothetical protein H6708_21800 [Kofleriaceae bacterium]|nr:hypothetical protein [Kofleriaceae bacterium]
MLECDVCGAKVQETRRGRCWGCYARWVDARPVGYGAKCLVCSERRRRMLRSIELWGGWQPMCFTCSGQLGHVDPVPRTVAELKEAISRERRKVDRRVGKADSRVFQYERRVGQRRAGRVDSDDCPSIDDDMIIEVIRDDDGADSFDDMTCIRELPCL